MHNNTRRWLALWFVAATQTALLAGQGPASPLAAAREALGGDERLSRVRSLTVTGNATRVRPDGTTTEHPFELSFEAPDRFVQRTVLMAAGPTSAFRLTGFNGQAVIDDIDMPPALAGGGNVVIRIRTGPDDDENPTAEQLAARRARLLQLHQQEFARLSLGLFAAAPSSYPLDVRQAGVAEAPEGKASVFDVTGPDGFAARLFVDAATHLPLMVSWQAPEPVIVIDDDSDGPDGNGDRPVTRPLAGRATGPGVVSQPGARPAVEHRLVFADYKTFDGGVRLPTRLQRAIAGRVIEEMRFERVRINPRIDPDTFAPRMQE
jgi:hypothetical protein